MLPNMGLSEMIVILVLALLLFGTKRLPEVARGVGKSFKSFKEGLREVTDEIEKGTKS